LKGKWAGVEHPRQIVSKWDTGVAPDILKTIGIKSVASPDSFTVHSRLKKHHIQPRLAMMESGDKVDWATAEALALGSLLLEGHGVRISGQDVGRGTFSQRHVQLVDQVSEKVVVPLNAISDKQGKLEVRPQSLER
jgi:probable 2-oxoglutarate dehydrogenase E1 component DHKTD1